MKRLAIIAILLGIACVDDPSPDATTAADSLGGDTPRVISLDERVDDSRPPGDSAPSAGASTLLEGIEVRVWDSRSGAFAVAGDSVGIRADGAPSGALLVVVAGRAPPGSIPATIHLDVAEGERVVSSSGFALPSEVGGDGVFRAPFLVGGARCLPLRLVARSEGGREMARTVVFTCDS
ncbi:MAG: hypothetical protein ACYC2G_17065 [Gemmatimonadaceae bacterium]